MLFWLVEGINAPEREYCTLYHWWTIPVFAVSAIYSQAAELLHYEVRVGVFKSSHRENLRSAPFLSSLHYSIILCPPFLSDIQSLFSRCQEIPAYMLWEIILHTHSIWFIFLSAFRSAADKETNRRVPGLRVSSAVRPNKASLTVCARRKAFHLWTCLDRSQWNVGQRAADMTAEASGTGQQSCKQ